MPLESNENVLRRKSNHVPRIYHWIQQQSRHWLHKGKQFCWDGGNQSLLGNCENGWEEVRDSNTDN